MGFGFVRFGGLCGVVGPVAALVMVFWATAVSPWFSWETNALSDLGVSEAAPIFNTALIIAGVLNFFFALAVRLSLPRSRINAAGSVVLILGGASLALVGIFTLDWPEIHRIVALGYFILFPVAMIILGAGLVSAGRTLYGSFTSVMGIAALVAIFGTPSEGLAIPEILEAIVLSAWSVITGARIMVRAAL